jgi:DNA-binding protein YbaB
VTTRAEVSHLSVRDHLPYNPYRNNRDFGGFCVEADKGSLETDLRELESRARRAQEEIAALAVEAKSKDGLIGLTLGSHGRLHALTLDPRVKRLDVDVLAERIVEMMNDALDLLQHETATKMSGMYPDFPAGEFFGSAG